jgi:hypothetical protein
MRRPLGLGLLGLGGFLLVLAIAVPFVLLDTLTRAPADEWSRIRLRAEDGVALDRATGRRLGPVTLEVSTTFRGDTDAATDEAVVWDAFTTLQVVDGPTLAYSERRTAFDPRTGETVNCCGEFVGDSTAVKQSGLAFRWPFFAERRDYPFFDPVSRQALPMRFQRVERIGGLAVYRYTQRVPVTRVGPVPGGVLPAAMLNVRGSRVDADGNVPAFVYDQVDRTYWVEPVTGTPVRIEERRRQTINTEDGEPRRISIEGHFVSVAEDVAATVADLGPRVRLLAAMRGPGPWALAGGGAAAIVLGALLYLPGRGRTAPPPADESRPDPAPPDPARPDVQ